MCIHHRQTFHRDIHTSAGLKPYVRGEIVPQVRGLFFFSYQFLNLPFRRIAE